jgi:hypothetical protein
MKRDVDDEEAENGDDDSDARTDGSEAPQDAESLDELRPQLGRRRREIRR